MILRRHFFFDLEDTLIAPVFQWSTSESLSQSFITDIPRPPTLNSNPLPWMTPCSSCLDGLSPVTLARLLMESSSQGHPFIERHSQDTHRVSSPFRVMATPEFRLFSFALHDQINLAQFHQHLAPSLFDELGFTPLMEPTVDSILRTCAIRKNIHPDRLTFSDMVDFWGKEGAFFLWLEDFLMRQQTHSSNSSGQEHQVFFIDDSLESGCRRLPHFNADIFLLHPQDLPFFLLHPLTLFPDHSRIFHGV